MEVNEDYVEHPFCKAEITAEDGGNRLPDKSRHKDVKKTKVARPGCKEQHYEAQHNPTDVCVNCVRPGDGGHFVPSAEVQRAA